jgi:hypothetical protein
MTHLEKGTRRLYSLMMGLYPAAFRKEFGEEMQGVFEEKLTGEKDAGPANLTLMIFRELWDLAFHAILERIKEWKGAPHIMFTPNPRIRIFSILTPIFLVGFLAIYNPRYVSCFFTDPLGWEIIAAVLLGLCVSWMIWRLPLPKRAEKYFLEELGMICLIIFMNLLIILGPAFIILSRSPIAATGSLAQFAKAMRWIVLGIDCVLLGAAIYMGIRRFSTFERKPG